MKHFKFIFPAILFMGSLIISCNENDEFKYDDGRTPLTDIRDIPLSSNEKLGLYENLLEYVPSGILLGCGIDMVDGYMNNETYRNLTNANFNAVTVGYHMKHGAIVSNTGTFNFQTVDNFVNALPANVDLFGHTLVWHQNQNKTYLNRLIAGTSTSANFISNSDFETEITGGNGYGLGAWNCYGDNTPTRSRSADGEGYNDEGYAMVIVNPVDAGTGNGYKAQTVISINELTENHIYRAEAWVKSTADQAVVQMELQNSSYVGQYSSTFTLNQDEWTKISYDFTAQAGRIRFVFDLGVTAATYYIDNVLLFDLGSVNIITNGDFENGNIDAWNGWGNGSTRNISAQGEGYNSDYSLEITNPASTNYWEAQVKIDFPEPLTDGHTYVVELWIKSSIPTGKVQLEIQPNYNYSQYSGEKEVGTNWQKIVWTFVADDDDVSFFVNYAYEAATYNIDNLIIYDETTIKSGGGGTVIELTPEEKVQIIDDAMHNWITEMVNHYKNRVHDWDVVNEPMTEGGSVRPGQETTEAADEFYWQYYLGSDYAVKAFEYARAACNQGDKLFINDYNLESNNSKLEGIINYVNYIEAQGQTVDGIGTQTHAYIRNADASTIAEMKAGIDNMFTKLAATGKLVKVSELDIRVGSTTPSPDLLELQSEMYRYVIESYLTNVPSAQQYGITIWGVSDGNNGSWLQDDAPCVWDKIYNRKPAYMGVANGLAGYDVSADWDYGYIIDAQN
ncbi:MAG: endo-1,4-beta-xylanase [Prevotellaceae bacterium]|nr:endo-1,4-beta-xylanase [Prevotellaceae bacterium]